MDVFCGSHCPVPSEQVGKWANSLDRPLEGRAAAPTGFEKFKKREDPEKGEDPVPE